MKQRKINLMYLLLIAVFVLSSCAKSSKNAKFIPADAAVVSLDVKQMFEKSKVGDNEEAKKKLLETIEGNAKTQDSKELIKKIVEDPAKAGVDLREPIYIFGNSEGKVGVIGTILDKDDFAQLLNALAKDGGFEAVKEKDGIQYCTDGNKYTIAFDDATFYGSESTIDDIVAKFKNDDTQNTMAENEDFAKLTAAQGYIKVLIPMAIAEGQISDIKKNLPEGAELKDLSIIMNLTSDKGVAKLDVECLAKSDAWKKSIDESNQMCGKISGDYVKYIEKGAFAIFANFNGKKLFEMMDKKDVFKDLGIDAQKELAKKVLESIDGDLAIGVGEFKGGMPNAAAYIKTKDQSVVDLAKENGMNPEKGLDFGFKDGATYVAVGETSAFTEVKETYQNVKGRRFYVACDLDLISNLAGSVNRTASQGAKAIGEHVSSAEMYDTSDTSIELVLNMKDKEKDPLEYFMQMFLKQIM
ncbi:MAG: DUF4836 family protein [Prevotella sp.]|nr:DUF4836 family protein [Prevotella sp.]